MAGGSAVAVRGRADIATVPADGYPALVQPGALSNMVDVLTENTGDTLTLRDLTRIPIPAGGGEFFEVPDPLGGKSNSVREIIGPMVGWRYVRLLFDENAPLGEAPPLCLSNDGRVPVDGGLYGEGGERAHLNLPVTQRGGGVTTRTCKRCPMSQWGSSTKPGSERGQACKKRLVMLAMTEGEILPFVISAPTMSIDDIKDRMIKLSISKGTHYSAFVYKWTLEKTSKNGNTFSKVNVEVVGMLEGARPTLPGGIVAHEEGSPAAAAYQYSQEFGELLAAESIAEGEVVETQPGQSNGSVPDHLGGDFDHEGDLVDDEHYQHA